MARSLPNCAIKISWEVQESLKMVGHGGLSEKQLLHQELLASRSLLGMKPANS